MVTGGSSVHFLEKEIISLLFSALTDIRFLSDHTTAWSVATWISLVLPSCALSFVKTVFSRRGNNVNIT